LTIRAFTFFLVSFSSSSLGSQRVRRGSLAGAAQLALLLLRAHLHHLRDLLRARLLIVYSGLGYGWVTEDLKIDFVGDLLGVFIDCAFFEGDTFASDFPRVAWGLIEL
jgi:hypothetical protein